MRDSDEIYCVGCGARIQTGVQTAVGYLPAGALAGREDGDVYCQRCFRLRHYNEIAPSNLTDDDFRRILTELGGREALVVAVVDLFDFDGSLISGLQRFIGDNPLLLVANKRDVLPHAVKPDKLSRWIRARALEAGLRPIDVMVVSAKWPDDVAQLMARIDSLRRGRDVTVVGVTNVGKSTLINAIVRQAGGGADLVTTSRFPGTTLDKIEIPLADGATLIDTPGIIQLGQMAHALRDPQALQLVAPKKEIKPRTYQLDSGQTLFLGGLARFDFVKGRHQGFTAYFDNGLKIHRTKLSGADDFFARHAGELLRPVSRDVTLVRHDFTLKAGQDLVVAGLGWLTGASQATVALWAPAGVDVLLRRALL